VFQNCPEDISVTANEFGEVVGEWEAPLAISNCGEVTITPSHNSGALFRTGITAVEYRAVDISGNTAHCRFNVTVLKQPIDIEISKVVTPDGDGVNDQWIVTNIEKFANNKIVIVDRWGSVIYAASGYNNGSIAWDGINQDGANVPTGTYFYSLSVRYGGDSIEKTGFIELIR
jgi:gliding motility-associated-like protein